MVLEIWTEMGDMDLTRADQWCENLDGKGGSWNCRSNLKPGGSCCDYPYGKMYKSWVIDLDGDGDLDIVQSEGDTPSGRIFWFENDGKGNKGKDWPVHFITSSTPTGKDWHTLGVADFDLDGDMDIFSCSGPLSGNDDWVIFENENGIDASGKIQAPNGWKEHIIVSAGCHEGQIGDVDGDGDVDIVSKPWRGDGVHVFMKNMCIENGCEPPALSLFNNLWSAKGVNFPDARIFRTGMMVKIAGYASNAYQLSLVDAKGRVYFRENGPPGSIDFRLSKTFGQTLFLRILNK